MGEALLPTPVGPGGIKGVDPFGPERRSEGNKKGWKSMSAEERSAWGAEMAQRRRDKAAEVKAAQEALERFVQSTMSVEEFKQELMHEKAVLAIPILWARAEAGDKDLLRWFVEQKIGRPGSKQEVEHSGGVTINIVRPPRGDVVEGEAVEDAEVGELPPAAEAA